MVSSQSGFASVEESEEWQQRWCIEQHVTTSAAGSDVHQLVLTFLLSVLTLQIDARSNTAATVLPYPHLDLMQLMSMCLYLEGRARITENMTFQKAQHFRSTTGQQTQQSLTTVNKALLQKTQHVKNIVWCCKDNMLPPIWREK